MYEFFYKTKIVIEKYYQIYTAKCTKVHLKGRLGVFTQTD